MDSNLRRLTPWVLLTLAAVVWFEELLPLGSLKKSLGDTGLMRFVLGLVCLYTMFLVIERQRMEVRFTEILLTFKNFYSQRSGAAASATGGSGTGGGGDPGAEGTLDREKSLEAVGILAAALKSPDPEVRDSAYTNLKRLTGKDFGIDSKAWQAWLEATRNAGGDSRDASIGDGTGDHHG